MLVSYLETFKNDVEAWCELSDLYLKLNMVEQALFCVEEAVFLYPLNAVYLYRYAQVNYFSLLDSNPPPDAL